MAQGGIGAASESDVTSVADDQGLNFDDETLKGKDLHQLNIVYCQKGNELKTNTSHRSSVSPGSVT